MIWQPFFHILDDFHHSVCSADHQKLNIIWKWTFQFLMIWWPFFCISGDFHCLDCLANHQKLNVIQKQTFHFLMVGSHFIAFWVTFVARITWQPSEVECNPKINISLFVQFGGHFFFILGDFHHSDHSVNHQKLNIIQNNHFMFWWFGHFLHFGWPLSLCSLGQSSEVEHNPKMSISFFNNSVAIFFTCQQEAVLKIHQR